MAELENLLTGKCMTSGFHSEFVYSLNTKPKLFGYEYE